MQFPLTRPLLALNNFTSDSTRRALNCVNVHKRYAQATDSYTLMRFTLPYESSFLPQDVTEPVNIDLQNIKLKIPRHERRDEYHRLGGRAYG